MEFVNCCHKGRPQDVSQQSVNLRKRTCLTRGWGTVYNKNLNFSCLPDVVKDKSKVAVKGKKVKLSLCLTN
jgi:hypothetical protein